MRVLDAEFVKGFMRMADDGWQQGWHERNGGNLSYRIKAEEIESVKEELTPGEWKPIGTVVPRLGGEYFLVTGSGKYFRNVTIKPEDSFCIIELDEAGKNYRICWGLMHIVEKSVEILVKVRSMTYEKRQTIQPGEFRHLARDFGVDLPEKFLYEKH